MFRLNGSCHAVLSSSERSTPFLLRCVLSFHRRKFATALLKCIEGRKSLRKLHLQKHLQPVRRHSETGCIFLNELIGARGFEPPTPWSRTRCSTRLSHAPMTNRNSLA